MRIVGFGDLLIHFGPVMDQRFMQAELMQMSFTGAEANVCAALALWGEDVSFVTAIPEHQLAKKSEAFLRGFGIDTRSIAHGEGRMGVYYLERGVGVRASSVIYDRDDSVFTRSRFEDYDWDSIFDGVDAFYLTGITPTLSDRLFVLCEKVLGIAREKGLRVFYDVNLRTKLCGIEKAREIFAKMSPYITDLIGNEEHLKQLLTIGSEYGEEERKERLSDIIAKTRAATGIERIAVTVRRTPSASESVFFAAYSDGCSFALSDIYRIKVLDRVGSGDAFSAGLVYAIANEYSVADTVDFATASCVMKHEITNDINFASVEEIKSIIGRTSSDVRR